VIETSARDGRGVEELARRMRDRVSVLYGPSGAGKSSLLNAIQPGLKLREGKISKYWQQGKHTTTFSRLHVLEQGGWVVDTPGIRVFRLHGARRSDLRDMFPDFEPFQKDCHFTGCTHDHEPGCRIRAAVAEGEVPESRYQAWLSLLSEQLRLTG